MCTNFSPYLKINFYERFKISISKSNAWTLTKIIPLLRMTQFSAIKLVKKKRELFIRILILLLIFNYRYRIHDYIL